MRSVPKSSLVRALISAAVALVSPLLLSPARANLVLNGGFEADAVNDPDGAGGGVAAGGGSTLLYTGSLAGWTVGRTTPMTPPEAQPLNVVATNSEGYYNKDTGGLFSGPHSGDVAAAFPRNPDYIGYITQNVTSLVEGQVYRISFYLSNQTGDSAHNSMTANWGGAFSNTDSPITGGTDLYGPAAIPVPTAWTYYSFDVTASASDAANGSRLSFTGGSTPGALLLDDVSIEAVPEVSSFGAFLGIGLLAFGTSVRVRRRMPSVA